MSRTKGSVCNISPLQVVNTLKKMGAPKNKISSVRTRSDMCTHISKALGKKCLANWKFKAFLGSGTYGSIFSVSNSHGSVRAAKIVSVNPGPEVRAQRKLASIGVAPKLYDTCQLSKGVWVIIMDQVDGSVQDLVGGQKSLSKRKMNSIFAEIVRNVEAMEAENLCHGDLSLDNLGYVTRPDGSFRVILIDFGWSGRHVPMFDMTSLAQSLLFTKNEENRNYLYNKTHAYILKRHGFHIPDSTEAFDELFRGLQKTFAANLIRI